MSRMEGGKVRLVRVRPQHRAHQVVIRRRRAINWQNGELYDENSKLRQRAK